MAKRGNAEGSIYKRKDGRWAGTITLADGKRKSVYGTTRSQVAQKLAAAQRTVHDGLPLAPEREATGHYLTRWLNDEARRTIRQTTWDGYERLLRLHVIPEIGKTRLARLSPQDLSGCYERLLTKGLSPRYVQMAHAVIHRALRQAERWNLIGRNPADLVDAPRPLRAEIQPLLPDQITHLLEAARSDRLEALYVLALTTGLRQGELLGLRWADIDIDARRLTVRQQVQRTRAGWVFTEPKTTKSRRNVVLPAVATDALARHRVRQIEEQLRAGASWQSLDLVFTSRLGGPIEKQNLARRSFQPLLAGAGLPKIRFHDLRHSAATLLLTQGVHPKVVQERLGHANISVTMDIYSHVLPTLQQDAADRLDRFFAAV